MALRRDRPSDKDGWTLLPSEGRLGDPPPWPLTTATNRERALWVRYWRKPQAIIWERDQMAEYVAVFVRQLAEAEERYGPDAPRKTVRLMFADLYLTPDSLARARLRIAPDEVQQKRAANAAPARKSTRSRLKVVHDGPGG